MPNPSNDISDVEQAALADPQVMAAVAQAQTGDKTLLRRRPQPQEVSQHMTHPSQLGVPLSAKLAAGEPSSGHPDGERELAPGIVVVTRFLADGVVMCRVKGDISEQAGYGTTWKDAVVDLLRAHRDWESAEGLAT
jgi:hypothetical protein